MKTYRTHARSFHTRLCERIEEFISLDQPEFLEPPVLAESTPDLGEFVLNEEFRRSVEARSAMGAVLKVLEDLFLHRRREFLRVHHAPACLIQSYEHPYVILRLERTSANGWRYEIWQEEYVEIDCIEEAS